MLNQIIAFSLRNRVLVLVVAAVLTVFGSYQATQLPIDVFPDLNRPTVTILTEAPGLAPEEVETLVTFPIESVMNGATNVERVRSASGVGLSVVWVEFAWGSDIFVDRQIVNEKLQLAKARLPRDVNSILAPISSIMGEIMLVGLRSEGPTSPMQLRTLADWTVRQRLLAVRGVSQVIVMGGELKQYQVLTSPARLAQHDITLDELTRAVEKSNVVTGGGFLLSSNQESLIRIVGRAGNLDDLRATVVRPGEPAPVTVGHVADVRFAGPVKRGDGGVNGEQAVILSIQKQPGEDTLRLDREIERTLDELASGLPADVRLERDIFKQANFIRTAIGNVEEAVRDGAIWVIVVLFVFLWNFRTSLITLSAIPLSILMTALVFRYFHVSINTMTLGGLAVAIGELVDDSIVDIENIFRRLKENRHKPVPDPPLKVIFLASGEVRNSIVYATLIVVLVVLPLFALGGLEGRMFAPLGLSYLTTLLLSLLVSLTVTPALASFLLPRARFLAHEQDSALVRWMKRVDTRALHFTLRHAYAVLAAVAVLVALAISSISWMGGAFLPDFNEGTLTLGVTAPPATNIAESNRLGKLVEESLLEVPEVRSVSRRTGRAEMDEHAENVNYSEFDVQLYPSREPRTGPVFAVLRAIPGLHGWGTRAVQIERDGEPRLARPRDEVLAVIRDRLARMPGLAVNVGQPISHRLDHIMSGIKAQIAVKLFGSDLAALREQAEQVRGLMERVPGVADLQVEPQVEIPQVRVTVKREMAVQYGLTPDDVAHSLETALQGRAVSSVLEGQRALDLELWFDGDHGPDLEQLRQVEIPLTSGSSVRLAELVESVETSRPRVVLSIDREQAAAVELSPGRLARELERALACRAVVPAHASHDRPVEIQLWFDERSAPDVATIRTCLVDSPGRDRVPLAEMLVAATATGHKTRLGIRREDLTRCRVSLTAVREAVERALPGCKALTTPEGQRTFDLVVWYDPAARASSDAIRQTLISTPSGARISLATVADVQDTTGPNTINREKVVRRVVVQCNTEGRDLASVVADIRRAIDAELVPRLPPGYYVEYGGQFEAQQLANLRLRVLAAFSLLLVFALLFKCLGSWQAALQVLVNIPLAAIGSVCALLISNWPTAEALAAAPWYAWPRVWVEATTLSLAHWIGFITLAGIVTRNGIMMISHYIHLMKHEGEKFDEHMIVRGSLERLAPVWMTALATGIGLVPLILGAGETGKEILHPLAVVVGGGLLSSTLLDQIVTPALFYKFGRRIYEHPPEGGPIADEELLHLARQFDR